MHCKSKLKCDFPIYRNPWFRGWVEACRRRLGTTPKTGPGIVCRLKSDLISTATVIMVATFAGALLASRAIFPPQKTVQVQSTLQDWEVRCDWTTQIAACFSRRSLERKDCVTSQKSVCEGGYNNGGKMKITKGKSSNVQNLVNITLFKSYTPRRSVKPVTANTRHLSES